MRYQAIVTREESALLAEFPDCPGCHTFVRAAGKLPASAKEALEGWLEAELAARRVPPAPKRHRSPKGGALIEVRIDPMLAARVQLRQARDRAGLTQVDLARRVGVSQQSIAKIEDPDRNVELRTLINIGRALGLELELTFVSDTARVAAVADLGRRERQGTRVRRSATR